ncbi:hypothetical protein ASG53_11935 [Sanguibacter sp. Leaf3]|nr:hypothetical protein ASG53_11935 [Sanguibacter sp. Leaf3]
MSVVVAMGISLLSSTFRVAASTQTRGDLWSSMTNASVQLIRDVNDGSKVTISEPRHLAVQVVRDGKCQTRDWEVVDSELISTTTFYDATSCGGGGSTERKVVAIKGGLSRFEFTYYSSASIDNALPAPVSPGVVNRVGWSMSATPGDSTAVLKLESGAAFTGRGASTDGTGKIGDPLAGFLSVITNGSGIEGVSAPVLSWTDATPELTQGWAVYRTSYPDGADAASSGGWVQVAYLPTATPAPGVMTYTDRTLPRGYTGIYVVRATVPDGYGPTSNQRATGLRPSAAAVTSDGTPTSIDLAWTSAIGSTGYDIYRTDGAGTATTPELYRRWDDIKSTATKTSSGAALRWSWTDTLPAGRAHTYAVVPVNRWERAATTSSQTASLPTGEALTKQYAGGTGTTQRVVRDVSNLTNNFTSPAAPTIALTANADWSNGIAYTPAPWSGGGGTIVTAPTRAADAGAHRDRGWETQEKRRSGDAWANLWTGGAEVPRGTTSKVAAYTQAGIGGQYRFYQARTVNTSGPSTWSGTQSILQRPAAPSCVATPTGLTTRQITVVGTPAPSDAPRLSSRTYNNGREGGAWYSFEGSETTVVFDRMTHNTLHGFLQKTRNASPANAGWSDPSAKCDTRTAELRVWLSDGSSTTRSISARLHNAGGNSASITVEGFQTQPSSGGGQLHSFGESNPGLSDGSTYTLTARLTDDYNDVSYQDRIATRELPSPRLGFDSITTQSIRAWVDCGGAPGCSVIGPDGQELGSGTTWSRLNHNRAHSFRGHSSDGWNHRYSDAQARTPELTVATPTCSVSRDGVYAPTTVRWSSSGSLSRSSVYAGSPGWYEAAATATRSDGWNVVQRENRCGTTVAQRPYVSGGATGGTPSAVCTQYQGAGAHLFRSAGGPPSGYSFGDLVQQYGIYRGGSVGTSDLSCNFFRQYQLVDLDGFIGGEWGQMVFWYQSGSGAS